MDGTACCRVFFLYTRIVLLRKPCSKQAVTRWLFHVIGGQHSSVAQKVLTATGLAVSVLLLVNVNIRWNEEPPNICLQLRKAYMPLSTSHRLEDLA